MDYTRSHPVRGGQENLFAYLDNNSMNSIDPPGLAECPYQVDPIDPSKRTITTPGLPPTEPLYVPGLYEKVPQIAAPPTETLPSAEQAMNTWIIQYDT